MIINICKIGDNVKFYEDKQDGFENKVSRSESCLLIAEMEKDIVE